MLRDDGTRMLISVETKYGLNDFDFFVVSRPIRWRINVEPKLRSLFHWLTLTKKVRNTVPNTV